MVFITFMGDTTAPACCMRAVVESFSWLRNHNILGVSFHFPASRKFEYQLSQEEKDMHNGRIYLEK